LLDGSGSISAAVKRTIATVIASAQTANAASPGSIVVYYH
jgi:hypothetical protein